MFAVLTRAFCGVAVLVGCLGNYHDAPEPRTQRLEPRRTIIQTQVSLTPIATVESASPVSYQDEMEYRVCRITAYCDRGRTASGVPSGVGQCAAPADIPFGSRIYIPELDRSFIVTDRTAKRYRRNTVDLFIPSRRDCKQFGCRYLECEISLPAEQLRYASPRLQALFADAVQ